MLALVFNYESVTVQVTVIASEAPLFTTENTVRHNMVPADEALKIPASTRAPVPVPAGNVQTYCTESLVVDEVTCVDDVNEVRDEDTAAPRPVLPAAAAVLSVPTSMCDITFEDVPIIREVM